MSKKLPLPEFGKASGKTNPVKITANAYKVYNNAETAQAAEAAVRMHIGLHLSPMATHSAQVMAAIFDGLNVFLNVLNSECKEMRFTREGLSRFLPEGMWQKMGTNKQALFMAAADAAYKEVLRSQEELRALITKQARSLDNLHPEALEMLLELQARIFKVASFDNRKDLAKMKRKKKAAQQQEQEMQAA